MSLSCYAPASVWYLRADDQVVLLVPLVCYLDPSLRLCCGTSKLSSLGMELSGTRQEAVRETYLSRSNSWLHCGDLRGSVFLNGKFAVTFSNRFTEHYQVLIQKGFPCMQHYNWTVGSNLLPE